MTTRMEILTRVPRIFRGLGKCIRQSRRTFFRARGVDSAPARLGRAGVNQRNAEALHEIDIPDWDKAEKSVVWAGPNASLRLGHWYVTVTALARLSDNRAEPHVQTRLITGFE